MKKIIGLDLGTNSIGWAVINANDEGKYLSIEKANSRIIPMTADQMGKYESGNTESPTAERTSLRGVRRLIERFLLRRERMLRVLSHIDFLPIHYSSQIDRYGKFIDGTEPKLAWAKDNEGKSQFLFINSYNEMLEDFKKNSPGFAENNHLSHDWTLYYLRKKALSQKISKYELSWILLSFLQKRGYNPTVGLDDEPEEIQKNFNEYFFKGKITSIINTGKNYKQNKIFIVELENGLKGKIFKKEMPDWIGQTKDIIVKESLNKQGIKRFDEELSLDDITFTVPTEDEWDKKWALVKKRTENELESSKKTIGSYIYDSLLHNPSQKIIGKLVRVVDRDFYYREIHAILQEQKKYHKELNDRSIYKECIELLYPSNIDYRNSISTRDMEYLIADNIILYQRPLKTKKSLIANCQYEKTTGTDGVEYGVKCISRTHPLFEEFRVWQWISNLKIYKRQDIINGKLVIDNDITEEVFPFNGRDSFFEWLNSKSEITMEECLSYPGFKLQKNKKEKLITNYRWNYVEDKSYPCFPIKSKILSNLKKAGVKDINEKQIENIWQVYYSISNKKELGKALETFCLKNYPDINAEEFKEAMIKMPALPKEYGSYSQKAIKKMLPLMRCGKYWNENDIDISIKERIQKLIDGEFDENIKARIREKASFLNINEYQGLPLWAACYVVYNRHSETGDNTKWETPSDIDKYISEFRHNSLNNPIVEQVVLETLKTIKDIWKTYGKPNEIHIELGRELKKTAKERENLTKQNAVNEQTNLRIKAMLLEFFNPEFNIDNVRPYSPVQQDLLRIYEDGALNSGTEIPDYINDTIKKYAQADKSKWPSTQEVLRYKCWLEQKYLSPYTGRAIPLGKLFTEEYQIEHVIPKARYFDDSFNNKVICEASVNQLKGSQLGYEFIKNHHGQKLEKGIEIFTVQEYEKFIKDHYSSNSRKMKNLLLEDIPETFTSRQMNDSRYISKLMLYLLSNIVRKDDEDSVVSKNVISVTGSVTNRLKSDWGLNDVWNSILLPRFERMNQIDQDNKYTAISKEGHLIPQVPLGMKIEKKRLDHRHHAMDAIIIACATGNHVNLISNEAAKSPIRTDLQLKLRKNEIAIIDGKKRNNFLEFYKPWDTFTQDVKKELEQAIVSFKQTNRVLTKTSNYYQKFVKQEDGSLKKKFIAQAKGEMLSVRQSLHKDSVYGHVNLRRIKEVNLKEAIKRPNDIVDKEVRSAIIDLLSKNSNIKAIKSFFEQDKEVWADFNEKRIPIYYYTDEDHKPAYAIRTSIDTSFTEVWIKEHVTDLGIQRILLNHLSNYNNKPDEAFSAEGIENMNRNIVELNGGMPHKPIYKVRKYEQGTKFAIGKKGNKAKKFVEGNKGSNLYFAIYTNEKGERDYDTISLNDVVSRLKKKESPVPDKMDDKQLLFYLKVGDLVYLPREEEINNIDWNNTDKDRIYKFVSSGKKQAFFIPERIASMVTENIELGPHNKLQRAISGEIIQSICVPLHINRLGIIQDD